MLSVELVLELALGDGVEGPYAAESDMESADTSGGVASETIPSC